MNISDMKESPVEFATTAKTNELKSSIEFPNPLIPLAEGIVAVGGKLDVGTLYHAYSRGVFPWPQEGLPMLWFCPDDRGVLFFNEYSPPKRFLQFQRQSTQYRLSWNENFAGVISGCQKQRRKDQPGTWILPALKKAYIEFHKVGFAHSVECWREDQLIAGLYGVFANGVFSGESMFHKEDNTSKLCLDYCVRTLQQQGLEWMDIQMVSPVLKNFGGSYISRAKYLKILKQAQIHYSEGSHP